VARRYGTKAHNIRIPDDAWEPFKRLARQRGTSASAEIVAFVRRYLLEHDTD